VVSGRVKPVVEIAASLIHLPSQDGFTQALDDVGCPFLDFPGGLSVGTLCTFPEFGTVLQEASGQTATASVGLRAGTGPGMLVFGLHGLGWLKNAPATITVKAGMVTVARINGGSNTFEDFNGSMGADIDGNERADSLTGMGATVGGPRETLDLPI